MKYVIGGLCSLAGMFLLFGLFIESANTTIQRDCLNSGKLVVNGSVYECKLIGKEIKP